MRADSLRIGKVFSTGGDVHYVLPHFQREYAWEKENWQTLVKDIFGIYDVYIPKPQPEHFMGALVVINDGTRNGTVPVFRLVDGQQRLTTISLMLCALSHLVEESHPTLFKKIRRLLVNEDEEGLLYYKLLPTIKYGDRQSYIALINGEPTPSQVESKIPVAYGYFFRELEKRYRLEQFEPEQLFAVLVSCLQVVFIDLDQQERPYEIFESLNYKGRPLTQADLVRNYIAMKLPEEMQEQIFKDYWSPIEETLLEKQTVGRSGFGELTAFLRHYFAYLSGVLINEEHVYSRFRDRGEALDTEQFVTELATLKQFAKYYERFLRPAKELDAEIRRLLQRLNILEISTAYPFLLCMYDWLEQGKLDRVDFLAGLKTLEIYIVRRFLVKESTNYLNKMFPTLARDIDLNNFDESLRQALVGKNFPNDVRIRQAAENVKMYNRRSETRRKLGLIFEQINRSLSAGSGAYTQLDADPSIEHIMPQTLTDSWREHLGDNWREDYDLLHTLGNLTVVTQEWNSALSNASYATKKAKLAQHGLLLNQLYFAQEETSNEWTGDSIRARAQWLTEKIVQIWPALGEIPDLPIGWKERPKELTILGESYEVTSWRDVLERTAECMVQLCGNDFESKIVSALPNYFSQEPFQQSSRELSNGWWLYVNLSSSAVKRICQSIIEEAGVPEDEFDLEIW